MKQEDIDMVEKILDTEYVGYAYVYPEQDQPIVDARMGMISDCPDQKLCRELVGHLAPIQMGEKEAGTVLSVERDVADQYFALEDQAVTMAELMMG